MRTLKILLLALGLAFPGKLAFTGEGGQELVQALYAQGQDIRYYGRWSVMQEGVLHAVETGHPPEGLEVNLKVAQLHLGDDGLRETHSSFSNKVVKWAVERTLYFYMFWDWSGSPQFQWYTPDEWALLASEGPAIKERIFWDKANGKRTLWEITNETNAFPYIDPLEHAQVYATFQTFIKQHDPDAKVVMGSLWDWNMVPEDSREKMAEMLHSAAVAEWKRQGLPYNWLVRSLITRKLAGYVRELLWGKLFQYSTIQYLEKVSSYLSEGEKPDYISVHFYPLDIAGRMSMDTIMARMGATLQGIADLGWGVPILVTEYGNANPYLTPEEVLPRVQAMTEFLEQHPQVAGYYFFKPTGVDRQVSLHLPGITPPYSRLVDDVDYQPDAETILDHLNSLGQWFRDFIQGGTSAEPSLK